MNSNTHRVTYEVSFSKDMAKGTRTYRAGVAYRFRTQSPSAHQGDAFDAAHVAIHRLFGCIKNGSYVSFLPLVADPKILTIVAKEGRL